MKTSRMPVLDCAIIVGIESVINRCMVTKSLKVSGAKQDAILQIYTTWNAFVDNGIHVLQQYRTTRTRVVRVRKRFSPLIRRFRFAKRKQTLEKMKALSRGSGKMGRTLVCAAAAALSFRPTTVGAAVCIDKKFKYKDTNNACKNFLAGNQTQEQCKLVINPQKNKLMQDKCRCTCGMCDCIDDPTFFFKQKKYNCAWVAKGSAAEKAKKCNKTARINEFKNKVKDYCRIICGTCVPTTPRCPNPGEVDALGNYCPGQEKVDVDVTAVSTLYKTGDMALSRDMWEFSNKTMFCGTAVPGCVYRTDAIFDAFSEVGYILTPPYSFETDDKWRSAPGTLILASVEHFTSTGGCQFKQTFDFLIFFNSVGKITKSFALVIEQQEEHVHFLVDQAFPGEVCDCDKPLHKESGIEVFKKADASTVDMKIESEVALNDAGECSYEINLSFLPDLVSLHPFFIPVHISKPCFLLTTQFFVILLILILDVTIYEN